MNLDEAVVVALGSNRPFGALQPLDVLEAALARFPAFGLEVVKRSSWWRSKSWPDPAQPEFLNGVALVETTLRPHEVMAALLAIEGEFDRRRGQPNAPRTLDLDLIAHGRAVIRQAGLQLPHPQAMDRRFVMSPLAEAAPGWKHPLHMRSAQDLALSANVGHAVLASPRFAKKLG